MRNLKPGEPLEGQPIEGSEPRVLAGAEVAPILENREASEFQPPASLEPPALAGAEAVPNLENRGGSEFEAAVNRESLAQAGAESAPNPENQEASESQPAVSLEPRVLAGAEAAPNLENWGLSESQPATSLKPLAQAGTEVAPIPENREALEVQWEASPKLTSQAEVSPLEPQPAARLKLKIPHFRKSYEVRQSARLPSRVCAGSQPISEHREALEVEAPLNREQSWQPTAEVPPITEHAEPFEAQPAATLEPPAQASAVLPMLEDAELPNLQPEERLEPPAQAGAEGAPIHEIRKALELQLAASRESPAPAGAKGPLTLEHRRHFEHSELPLHAGAEVQAIRESREALEPRPVASPKSPARPGAEVEAILEPQELLELQSAASPELTLQAEAVLPPVTEHAEPFEAQPAATLEQPAHFSAGSQHVLKNQGALENQTATSPELTSQDTAEVPLIQDRRIEAHQAARPESPSPAEAAVPPIIEHRNLLEFQPTTTLKPPPQFGAEVYERSVAKDNETIKLDPKFEVTHKSYSLAKSEPDNKVSVDTELAAPEGIQASDSRYYSRLGQATAANGKKAAPLPKTESISEDQSAANEERTDKGWLDVSLRQVTEGAAQPGDKVDTHADLEVPEAIKARGSENDVKVGRLAAANAKKTTAPMAKDEITLEGRSSAKEELADKGWLGMSLRQVTESAAQTLNVQQDHGALIAKLNENSPAKTAGIEPGDIIVDFDGKNIKDWRDLPRMIVDTPPGKEVPITFIRKGTELTKVVKIGRSEDSEKSFTSTEESTSESKPMRKNARGFNTAASAVRGGVTFGRRKAMAASQ